MEKIYRILKLLIWILAFAVILTGAWVLYNQLSPQVEIADPLETVEQEAQAAADFTVYDGEGNPVKLSDFSGKPVILNFWASWCGPCVAEMPVLQQAFETYGQDIQFLMVNATGWRETVDSAKEFLAEQEYTFPVYFDTDGEAAAAYGINAIPVTYFIDPQGNLAGSYLGSLTEQTLQQQIERLLED